MSDGLIEVSHLYVWEWGRLKKRRRRLCVRMCVGARGFVCVC